MSAFTNSICFGGLLQCQFTEATIRGQTCRSPRTHYSDSEPANLCSYSLMLRAQQRSNTYKSYSLLFNPKGSRTYDLPHARLTIAPPMRFQQKMATIRKEISESYEWSLCRIPQIFFKDKCIKTSMFTSPPTFSRKIQKKLNIQHGKQMKPALHFSAFQSTYNLCPTFRSNHLCYL